MNLPRCALLRTSAAAVLLVALAVPWACVTGPPKLKCPDAGRCVSDPGCPLDQPDSGSVCETPVDADCFYCSEGTILQDASKFNCRVDPDEKQLDPDSPVYRFKRLSNLNCE